MINLRSMCYRYFFPALLIISFFGCSSTYQNITGYFNTYYNAQKLFGDAVNEIENAPNKSIDSLYFVPYAIQQGSQDKFDKVIEKCSHIIQSYPQSNWVDHAILMIGESYVYKGESESGIRKFQELLQNFPNSNLRREAKLWDAKAEFFMKKEDEALKILEDLYPEARSEGDNEILFTLLMMQGQIAFERSDYGQASTKYGLAAEVSVDDQKRAIASYLQGFTIERINDPEKAAEAYAKVRDRKPDFRLEFQSRLRYGRMLAQAGHPQRALKSFDELFDEPLRPEEKSLVDLEIANTDWSIGDTASAYALYRMIDTTYRHTDAAAKGYFERGKICERQFTDFKQARDYYTKARDEFASSEIVPQAQKRALAMGNYFQFTGALHQYDSLLVVTIHQDSVTHVQDSIKAFKDSVSSALMSVTVHRDTMNRTIGMHNNISDSTSTSLFSTPVHQDSTTASLGSSETKTKGSQISQKRVRQDEIGDSLMNIALNSKSKSSEVNAGHDSSGVNRMLPPDNGPGVRDSSRNAPRVAPPGMDALTDSIRQATLSSVRKGSRKPDRSGFLSARDSLRNKPVQFIPPAPARLTPDSIRTLLALNEYELAGLFFLELHLNDSAIIHYNRVLQKYPTSPYVVRSLYALAEIRRTVGDSTGVDSLYAIILGSYPKSEYAAQIRKLKGVKDDNVEADTTVAQYRQAETLLQSRNAIGAISLLKNLWKQHPASSFAPKSLYTIGWAYENIIVNNDSAAAWYQRLVKYYPASVYAMHVQPKLAVKADPKSLPQYVKINEILPLHVITKPSSTAVQNKAKHKTRQTDEEMQKGRSREQERDIDDNSDDTIDEDKDLPDLPDESDDTDDNN